MDYKDFLDDWFDHYDQVQIGTTQGGRCVQKQKGGNGSKQLQIAHLKTGDGEEIHVNYNRGMYGFTECIFGKRSNVCFFCKN